MKILKNIYFSSSFPSKDINLFQRFPQKSSFSCEEHKLITDAIKNIWRKTINENLMKKYSKLQDRITKEYEEFDIFVKNHFMTYSIDRKKTVDPACELLLIESWKSRVSKILEKPKKFRLETALPLKFHGSIDEQIEFNYSNLINFSNLNQFKIDHSYVRELLHRRDKVEFMNYYIKAVQMNQEFVEKKLKDIEETDFLVNKEVLAMLLTGFHLDFKEWNFRLEILEGNVFKFEDLPRREMSGPERSKQIVTECLKGSILKVSKGFS